MYRKMTAVALAIVMIIVTTACGKGGTDRKVPLKKQGFRIYKTENKQGIVAQERKLIKELEDTGTERTFKEYDDDGNVTELVKWYRDDSGEHLLKQVIWNINSPTYSYEFDANGRTIREYKKIEKPEEELLKHLSLPTGIFQHTAKKFLYVYFSDRVGSDVTELRTEYTYFGDSERLKTIKTVTNDGTVVASFEMGEEDIVISGFIRNDDESYEETYDPDTNKGTWKHLAYGEVFESGTKTYDSSGRCVYYSAYSDTRQYLMEETSAVYDDEGAQSVTRKFDYDKDAGYLLSHETRRMYDGDGYETYVIDQSYDEDGRVTYGEAYHRTYHKNGKKATVKYESWDDESQEMVLKYEESYDEDGELTDSYTYGFFGNDGKLSYETHIVLIDAPDVAGKVKHKTVSYYPDKVGDLDYNTLIVEEYNVCMTDEYGRDDWYQYLEVRTTDGDRKEYKKGTFDSDGHLIEVTDDYGDTVEFDQQGRIFREKYEDWDDTTVTLEYEYWEIEPENP